MQARHLIAGLRKWGAAALLIAALASVAMISAPHAHAAPMTQAAPGPQLVTPPGGGGCGSTYWSATYQYPAGVSGYSWRLGVYTLRDASSGVYCGTFFTEVCVTVPPPGPRGTLGEYHLYDDTYINNKFIARSSPTYIDVVGNPNSYTACNSGSQYGATTGTQVLVVGNLIGFDGDFYGGADRAAQFTLS